MSRHVEQLLEEGKESAAAGDEIDDLDKMLEDVGKAGWMKLVELIDSKCFFVHFLADIDKDFDAFMAESKDEHDAGPPDNNDEEEEVDWDERLSRTEVFSTKYRISLAETREIGRLQEALGIPTSGSHRSLLSIMGKSSKQKYTTEQTKAWSNVTQNSVQLKRGSCRAKFHSDDATTKECELCLFTKGMVFFTLSTDEPLLKPLIWDNVSRIIPNDGEDSIRVETTPGSNIVLEKAISDWKTAIVSCFLNYIERNDTERTSNLGWQHQLVYTPGFSEAVSNDTVAIKPPVVHDEHNQLTPLLYAVKLGHAQAAKSLLEDFAADPNQPDGEDGTVPLYWADSDEMKQLLLQFGAKDGQRHELFDRVVATQANVDRQRQQQRDAEAAKISMQDNMKLINERGQKIEELGDTAQQLNENAAEFRDLSGQLKSKLKQRSARWGLF